MMSLKCPYCEGTAFLNKSEKVYGGRDFGMIYLCENYPKCDSYVGTHAGTEKPLGRLANKELRQWKRRAHTAFDELWMRKLIKRRKETGSSYKKSYARGSGYRWLSKQLLLKEKDCHIAMFDVDMCKRVIEVCSPYLKKNQA